MNKECREELDKVKEQSYKIFLHNLLLKEERAEILVGRVQFKYLMGNVAGALELTKISGQDSRFGKSQKKSL